MVAIVALGIIILILIVILVLVYAEDYASYVGRREGRLVNFTQKKGRERRKTLRLSATLNIRYRLLDEKQVPKTSQSKNISVGGAGILIYEKLNESTKLEVEIEIPYQLTPVKAICEVIWLREKTPTAPKQKRRIFTAGIKFIKIDPLDEAKLLEYVYATLP